MAEHYCFYLVKRNKNGIFESLGPWGIRNNGLAPMPLIARSRGHMQGLIENLKPLDDTNKIEESMKYAFGNTKQIEMKWISMESVLRLAKSRGFTDGYVLKEKINNACNQQNIDRYYDEIVDYNEYITTEEYLSIPNEDKSLYTYHAQIHVNSKGYLANLLIMIAMNYYEANAFRFLEYLPIKDLYFLVEASHD